MHRRSGHRPAFTLIELLVVVTIIVVLLALLTPALDKAIYSAELAACGGNMKGVGSGVLIYAMNHQRRYPVRLTANQPQYLAGINLPGSDRPADDRPQLLSFVGMKMYVDPLCEPVDLSIEASDPEAQVVSSYSLWYGWKYDGYAGMLKVGDRFAWDGITDTGQPRRYRFQLLMSDRDVVAQFDPVQPIVSGSHPDDDGLMTTMALQNDGWDEAPGSYGLIFAAVKVTLSTWIASSRFDRGSIDMNYVMDDGSVSRLEEVPWDFRQDPRITGTPESAAHDNWPDHFNNLPVP